MLSSLCAIETLTGRRAHAALLAAILACAWPLAAHAAGTDTLPIQSLNDEPSTSTNAWDITAGTGVGYSPIYPGSKRYEPKPIFFGSISLMHGWSLSTEHWCL